MPGPDEAIRALQVRFGANMRRRRIRLRLSHEALSERCGITRSYLSKLEAGRAKVRLDTMVRLALALGTSPVQLLRADRERRVNAAKTRQK